MFFFFQAEDGIRDYKVTGVQTCALPIFTNSSATLNAPTSGQYELLGGTITGGTIAPNALTFTGNGGYPDRSGEGRGGEEGRSRWGPDHLKKKKRTRQECRDERERSCTEI